MKLSYLIATNHGPDAARQVIDGIYALPSHNFEIITSAGYDFSDHRSICIRDSGSGSVNAFNSAYKLCTGDCVVICVDDHSIPHNMLTIIDFFNSEKIKNLKLKIANMTHAMGGPGKLYWDKIDTNRQPADRVLWPLESVLDEFDINRRPFNIYHFPAFMKESVDTYMNGVIFNESFKHHYCDSWLGFYEEIINGKRDSIDLGPIDCYFNVIPSINNKHPNRSFDAYDHKVFKRLVALSDVHINYNHKVEV